MIKISIPIAFGIAVVLVGQDIELTMSAYPDVYTQSGEGGKKYLKQTYQVEPSTEVTGTSIVSNLSIEIFSPSHDVFHMWGGLSSASSLSFALSGENIPEGFFDLRITIDVLNEEGSTIHTETAGLWILDQKMDFRWFPWGARSSDQQSFILSSAIKISVDLDGIFPDPTTMSFLVLR